MTTSVWFGIRVKTAVGWIVILLSVGHFYLVYPGPTSRLEELQGSTNAVPVEQLAALVMESWVGGLLIVVLGLCAGLHTLFTKGDGWKWSVILYSIFYLVIWWWFSVLSLEKGPIDFIKYKLLAWSALISMAAVGPILVELHRNGAAVVFHVLFVVLAYSLMVGVPKEPQN